LWRKLLVWRHHSGLHVILRTNSMAAKGQGLAVVAKGCNSWQEVEEDGSEAEIDGDD
jgi:hypothetical protein